MTKKLFLFFLSGCVWMNVVWAQQGLTHSGQPTGQAPRPIESYTELENPAPTDLTKWTNVKSANVAWGSTDERYPKELPILKHNGNKLSVKGWRGERVHAQFVVWTNQAIDNLSYEITPLRHTSNRYSIANEQIHSGFVRYVMTDELNKDGKGGCGHRPDLSKYDSTLVADVIDHWAKELPVKANTAQPVWISIDIPQEATPGQYNIRIAVRDGNRTIKTLNLVVDVANRVLPAPTEWAFFLDLWQNPYAVARYYGVEPWSDAHFEAMRPYMEMYRDAGGKTITASIMHKPWNGQTLDYFESMITWMKKADGTWRFDYTVFDKWVEFMHSLGIRDAITCYSMVPWNLSFQYFDQASNSFKFIDCKPGDDAYSALWGEMLKSFSKHLREKGWFEKTYISMDERSKEAMKHTIALIKKADSEFNISLAGNLYPELADEMNYYCVNMETKYPEDIHRSRKDKQQITTFYTCCAEARPNTFTFSPLAESEFLGWYAASHNLDGYLRWAYNSWVSEPLLDSRFYSFAAGDTYLVYPGARSSMRYERLISGIQSFEKVRILRQEFETKGNKRALRKLDAVLKTFDDKKLPQVSATSIVENANRVINAM